MKTNRWEMGSFFSMDDQILVPSKSELSGILAHSGLYLNGRSALLDIIEQEKRQNQIRKIYVPSYYCHSVTKLLEQVLTVEFYDCDFKNEFEITQIEENSLILLVEYFGLQSKCRFTGDVKAKIIIDKTYDPFSDYMYDFMVSYVFGSLRKVFPIYDGGFVYPRLEDCLIECENISKVKTAMLLKHGYLQGQDVEKSRYLNLYYDFEQYLDSLQQIYAMSSESKALLAQMNIEQVYQRRKENLEYVSNALQGIVEIFSNPIYFSIFVESENVDWFKKYLIEKHIYPIILWNDYDGQLPVINDKVLFCFHMDYRYKISDLDIFVKVIKDFYKGANK